MPLVSTAELMQEAQAQGCGIAAFNIITVEYAEAIAMAAERANLPAIMQISENCTRFHRGQLTPIVAAAATIAEMSSARLAVHLDHIQDQALLYASADLPVSSIMYDGAELDYVDNVDATRAYACWAHERGLYIEAELGAVGGKDGVHAPHVRTNSVEALDFVLATGVDALAVAVGNSHAMRNRNAAIDLGLIAKLREMVPVPLVLHGSSGVSDELIRAAIAHGMVKINIGTALNIAFSGEIERYIHQSGPLSDPRKYLMKAREAIRDCAQHFIEVISG